MSLTLESVTAEALKLTPDERAELIETLLASVQPSMPLHPEWEAEIERRVADMDAGRTTPIPGEEVFAKVRALIAAHDQKA